MAVVIFLLVGCGIITASGLFIAIFATVKNLDGSETAKVKDWVELGGGRGLAIVVSGLLAAGVVLYLDRAELFPSTTTGTTASDAETTSGSEQPAPIKRAFQTPRKHVYCSTYLEKDQIACRIKDQKWGEQRGGTRCDYLFVLGRTGPATSEACPDETALEHELYGIPIDVRDPAVQLKEPADYDRMLYMGSATCMSDLEKGVTCVNDEGYGFRIATEQDPEIGRF